MHSTDSIECQVVENKSCDRNICKTDFVKFSHYIRIFNLKNVNYEVIDRACEQFQ